MKRTFDHIRREILINLSLQVDSTINNISKNINVNWRTVEKHLVYLVGKGYVNETFTSEYVRIVEVTDKGQELAAILEEEDIAI